MVKFRKNSDIERHDGATSSSSGTSLMEAGNVTKYVCPPSGFISDFDTAGREWTFDIEPNISWSDNCEPDASAVALISPEYSIDPPDATLSNFKEKLDKEFRVFSPGSGETVMAWTSPCGVAVDLMIWTSSISLALVVIAWISFVPRFKDVAIRCTSGVPALLSHSTYMGEGRTLFLGLLCGQ